MRGQEEIDRKLGENSKGDEIGGGGGGGGVKE